MAATPLLGFTLFQSFFTTGIIYGWPALLLVLTREGVYRSRCPELAEDCDERALAFNMVFSLGAMFNVGGGVFVGAAVDRLGPRVSIVCGLCQTIAGSLLMAFAPSDSEFAWPLAYILYALGGAMAHMAAFSLQNAFSPARKGFVTALFVCTFSLSSLTFQLMWLLYDYASMSRQALFLCHAGLEAANLLCSARFWPLQIIERGDKLQRSGFGISHVKPEKDAAATASAGIRHSAIRLARSVTFLGFATFHCTQIFISRSMMGWADSIIQWKQESIQGVDRQLHLNIFNVFSACLGILAIPPYGWLVGRYGHRIATFVATNSLAVLWLACLLMQSEVGLVAAYAINAWHRQFFFSTMFGFLIGEFPISVFGRLTGFASLMAGAVSYLQNPLLDVILRSFDGDFTTVLLAQIALVLLMFGFPVTTWWRAQHEPQKPPPPMPVSTEVTEKEKEPVEKDVAFTAQEEQTSDANAMPVHPLPPDVTL